MNSINLTLKNCYLENVDLDERLVKILNEVDVVMNIHTDFEM